MKWVEYLKRIQRIQSHVPLEVLIEVTLRHNRVMPELPEVETVTRGLKRLIVGKKIISQTSDWAKSFPNDLKQVDEFMIGAKIMSVERRGKAMIVGLSTKYSLVIHLKMTGQLVYIESRITNQESGGDSERFAGGHPNDSLVEALPDRSTRVEITFSDKTKLFFNDQRKFGYMKLLPTVEVPELPFFKKLGPEPLVDSFTSKEFAERMKKRANTTVKAAILDQSVLAGVGNIYADEALFGARTHPARRVKELTEPQLATLLGEIKDVMNLSIEKGGSTNKNYVDAEGREGSYMDFARVFRREGEPCLIDGTVILKSRVAGRGTHYCPTCQPVPRGFKQ